MGIMSKYSIKDITGLERVDSEDIKNILQLVNSQYFYKKGYSGTYFLLDGDPCHIFKPSFFGY